MPSVISGSSNLIVVSNTTPISELAKIGRLDLLRNLYGRIFIPQEVFDELTTGTHPAAQSLRQTAWIEIRPVTDPQKAIALHTQTKLGLGECEAIILTEELSAHRLLIDDHDARREALSRNLPIIGTVGIILLAKQLGLIPTVKDILDDLIAHGTRIGRRLYLDALAVAGE
jgi:hypothetical protein